MSIAEIIALLFVLFAFLGLFAYACIDNHKNSVAYRKAMESVTKIHFDLVELVNFLKESKGV